MIFSLATRGMTSYPHGLVMSFAPLNHIIVNTTFIIWSASITRLGDTIKRSELEAVSAVEPDLATN